MENEPSGYSVRNSRSRESRKVLVHSGPVAVSLMMMYLALLFVETRIVVGYVKTLDSKSKGGGTGNAAGPTPQPSKPQAAQEDSSAAPCVEVLA